MAEPFTIYKMTILYMLSKVDFPLTNVQIADFFLEQQYTGYFEVQGGLNELEEAGMIRVDVLQSHTQYTLTADGEKTLSLLSDKITDGIREDVRRFFETNQLQMKQDNYRLAEYRKVTASKFQVHCRLLSDDVALLDVKITVRSEQQAREMCRNWKQSNEDVYALLMDTLLP